MRDRRILADRSGATRLVVVCLAAMVFSGVAAFLCNVSGGPQGGELIVPDWALDIGEPWAQRNFQWTLPIHNTTSRDIHVSELRSSCGCTAIHPRSFTVPAGKTVPVRVTFNLLSSKAQEAAVERGQFSISFTPITSEPLRKPVRWQVHGRVVDHPLSVSETTVEFGENLVLGAPFPSKVIVVKCSLPIAKLTATTDGSLVVARVRQLEDDSQQYTVEIIPQPDLDVGDYQCEVQLRAQPEGGGSKYLPELPLEIAMRVRHEVTAEPEKLFLGSAGVGAVLQETVVLSSNEKAFSVVDVQSDSTDSIEIEPLEVPGIEGQVFRVSSRVVSTGAQETTVRFTIRHGEDSKPYELSVPVFYRGLEVKEVSPSVFP